LNAKRTRYSAALLLAAMLTSTASAQEGTPALEGGESQEELKGTLEGMAEQLQALQSDTDKLKKFKFSGYVQARWQTSENKSDTVRVERSPAVLIPANTERFFIRRARLKMTYDSSPLSRAVVYFDGGQDRTIRLLEAYVTWLDPWTPLHAHALSVGQMNVPFGYEIERSSSARELPERSLAQNVLFPGERDRGIKLVSQWTPQIETMLGVFNGGGVSHPDFPDTDPTRAKDLIARARYSQGTVDGAVSFYSGKNTTALTGEDVETDKTRLGLDGQFYYALPMAGGGSLRGEFYSGKNVNRDSVKVLTVAASSSNPVTLLKAGADPDHFATDFTGWYAMWVQNLGESFEVAVRYDLFDPNTDLDHDQFERTSLGLNWFYDGFTRLSVSYDIPRTDRSLGSGGYDDPKDNLWTLQFQHKF